MTPTTSNNTLASQPLAHYDPQVAQRVHGWLASGQPLAWIPILSQDNFPDTPHETLQSARRHQAAMRWPIHQPEDLLDLPEGVTGWLLPADAEDTDVACGVWGGEVYILGVTDRRTGRAQTLLGERGDAATDRCDNEGQSPV
ncbi:hypothetical protein A9O67_08190 [Tepidimonas fonticaldi]|uniref:Uncharacterized protein n=1 Tax=Tepidimonas fonticaldi TaxID=1101373 RepID=A0A1A6DSH9_9BURK|nr:hypothetical protein [Tepidimonas fonticaldi]OBS29808.1 hypothetical protein A9O67_08190 [Tepidimonas fonticaldi]